MFKGVGCYLVDSEVILEGFVRLDVEECGDRIRYNLIESPAEDIVLVDKTVADEYQIDGISRAAVVSVQQMLSVCMVTRC